MVLPSKGTVTVHSTLGPTPPWRQRHGTACTDDRLLPFAAAQAVEADAIDILAVQAPDCKLLPDSITDLLSSTRSSILVYNQKAEPSAAAVMAAAGAIGSANVALADAAAAAACETGRRTVEFEL